MHGLRTLIAALILTAFAWNPLFALNHSLSLKVQTDSRKGSLDIADLGRQFKTDQVTETLTYRLEGIAEHFSTQAEIAIVQPDYSSVLVRNQKGAQLPLSLTMGNQTEFLLDLSADWARGSDRASLGWKGSLGESPFASHLLHAAYTRSFFSQTSSLGIEGSYLSQAQPSSFFIDRDFQNKARPTLIHAYEAAFLYEQTLTENWKMRNRMGVSRRLEERPLNYFISTQQAYALSDRLFANLKLNYADELRSQPLLNERGYFRAYGATLGLHAELFYDLLVSLSYGILFERERDPRSAREIEVASDQYGFGVHYSLSKMTLNAEAGYVVTNTNIKHLSVSGGATWRL